MPYANEPQFQIGYKGYIQLAQKKEYDAFVAGIADEGIQISIDQP